MTDLLAMAVFTDSIREATKWHPRCSHCYKKALTTTKFGSWRADGFPRLHRWVAGGKAECGLRMKR